MMTTIDQLIGLGMTALLNDHSTRDAVIDYIKALTAEHKPRDQWQEVYWRQSEDTRIYLEDHSHITAIKHDVRKIKCTVVILGKYDANAGIGSWQAFLWGDGKYRESNFYAYIGSPEPLLYESMIAHNLMDVVNSADAFYGKALAAWIEKTEDNRDQS